MQRELLVVAGLFAAGALAFAYTLQLGFGIEPCNLCWWQRYPYMAALPVAILGLVSGRCGLALWLIIALFAIDAGIAWYHGGVEAGIFSLPESCSAVGDAKTIEELKAQLLAAPPSCDQVSWALFGISLSVWNAIAATSMAVLLAVGSISRRGRSRTASH